MHERLPHRKPGTAGGQYRMRLLCAVAAAPILARSDRQCTRVTATLEYGAQASMIELGSSICAELHYCAFSIIEYYIETVHVPLGTGHGGRYVSRDVDARGTACSE